MRWTDPLLVLALAATAPAWGRTRLITLPARERVQIELDNPNATLVEEERIVPLVKGANEVDFSWANTKIDPDTIVFRVMPAADGKKVDVKVLSVSYPPDESALVWTVGASDSASARVRISYLLGNLGKSFNYRAVASSDETTIDLSQYMRLHNFADEEYGNAALWAGMGKGVERPIGLNETREMLIGRFAQVPIHKTYTCDPQEIGFVESSHTELRVLTHYVLKNKVADNLGAAPLPFGKVRMFIEGQERDHAAAFLGEDWGRFTPIDGEMKLYLGPAQDIEVKRTITKSEARRVAGNLFDQDVTITYDFENMQDQAATLEVNEHMRSVRNEVRGDSGRDVEWEIGPQTTFAADGRHLTFDHAAFQLKLPPRDKQQGTPGKLTRTLQLTLRNEW